MTFQNFKYLLKITSKSYSYNILFIFFKNRDKKIAFDLNQIEIIYIRF